MINPFKHNSVISKVFATTKVDIDLACLREYKFNLIELRANNIRGCTTSGVMKNLISLFNVFEKKRMDGLAILDPVATLCSYLSKT